MWPRPGLAPAAGPDKARYAPPVGLSVAAGTKAAGGLGAAEGLGPKSGLPPLPPGPPAPLRYFYFSPSVFLLHFEDDATREMVSGGQAVTPLRSVHLNLSRSGASARFIGAIKSSRRRLLLRILVRPFPKTSRALLIRPRCRVPALAILEYVRRSQCS